jgi:threonine synthase
MKQCRQGLDLKGKRVVCVITGSGLKDPDLAVSSIVAHTIEVKATIEAVEAVTLELVS